MKTSTKQTLKIFWQHARKYPGTIIVSLISLFGFIGIEIYVPFWYKKFFDILATGNTESVKTLISITTAILILNSIGWLFRRISNFRNNFFEPRVMSNLVKVIENVDKILTFG